MGKPWLCLATIALMFAFGQSPEPQQPIRTMEDLDKFLAKPLSDKQLLEARTHELQECQSHNLQLQQNLDSHREVRLRIFIAFTGVGAGLLVTILVFRQVKHAWSASPAGKQLMVMVLGATWISAVALIEANNEHLSGHPLNLAFAVAVYSIPAVLFSGIGMWWLGKRLTPS